MTDRYLECPLATAGFRLQTFSELPPLIIGADGKCICTHASHCMDVDKRDGNRCTLAQLRDLDSQAVRRRAWQSGD